MVTLILLYMVMVSFGSNLKLQMWAHQHFMSTMSIPSYQGVSQLVYLSMVLVSGVSSYDERGTQRTYTD